MRPVHRSGELLSSVLVSAVTLLASATPAYGQNPVVLENLRAGTDEWLIAPENRVDRTEWLTTVHSVAQIEGYASLTSVGHGETIRFFVDTAEPSYQMRFYRIGWYGGLGAREITKVQRNRVEPGQPSCTRDAATLMVECNWLDPYELTIPPDWVSGFYLVKLTPETTRKENYIIFVVRDDSRPSPYLFLSAVNTYQAYNLWGGYSLYPNGSRPPGTKVSFNRPYGHWNEWLIGSGQFFEWEIQMVRWLEREGYDVSYATNVDAHVSPGMLLGHDALLSVGHDEYWSWEMRENVERARARCVSLGFFSANSVYWQIRYEPSPATGQPDRTMVAYKDVEFLVDPLATDGIDSNDHLITTLWRDPRPGFLRPKPEDALLGVAYAFFPVLLDFERRTDIVLSYPGHWALAGTSETRLPGLVGYEADRMFASAPPGTERLAHSPVSPTGGDYDCDPAVGNCFSDMTIYEAPSRALVFATGTIQWSWGLDDFRVPGSHPRPSVLSPDAQQITRNVLEAFRRTPCDLNPEVSLPPPAVADIGVSVGGVSSGGDLTIIECLRDVSCWFTTRGIRPGYPVILIYGRSEMQQIPPMDFQLPEPVGRSLVGSLYDLRTTAQFTGTARITLSYDAANIPEHREADLDVLYLAQGNQGSEWRVADAARDAKENIIQARLPALSTLSLALRPLTVSIDIKPGDDQNSVNLNAAGVIPIAILSSQLFDAATVDASTLVLGGGKVKVTGRGNKSLCHLDDVNEDGLPDLVCQVTNVSQYETVEGEAIAALEARTTDGTLVRGADRIRIVPPSKVPD